MIFKFLNSGLSIFYSGTLLFFIVVHNTLTSESSRTAEYCIKYGFLASQPDYW